jgi:hypothetical protein
MKAIIKLDVPDYQIGQEVHIYFKDTMMVKGICEEAEINQVMLGLTTPEEFVRKIDWLYHEYGKRFNNSEPAIIEWLKQKGSEVEG